jgi:hypothetical protein
VEIKLNVDKDCSALVLKENISSNNVASLDFIMMLRSIHWTSDLIIKNLYAELCLVYPINTASIMLGHTFLFLTFETLKKKKTLKNL